MTKKVFNMQGGMHSAAAFTAFENGAFGSVKSKGSDFTVTAGTGMNINISAGNGIISTPNSGKRIQSDAVETVSVSAASATYSRIDSVVAYIDNAVQPTTSVIDNTNGILNFAVVSGTASGTPTAPSQAMIQSAIGASNNYMILANITIPAGATSLTNATFTNVAATPMLASYPIGAVYISIDNTNPAELFGGTWESFATGRTLVGVDSNQTEFDEVEKTGGEKTHALTKSEMPAHTHNITAGGSGSIWCLSVVQAGSGQQVGGYTSSEGSGAPHNNLQPYITTYMWKRTA